MVTEHMICIVQIYIHIRKNKEVKIRHPRNAREFFLLNKAYDYAVKWMDNNEVKITNNG